MGAPLQKENHKQNPGEPANSVRYDTNQPQKIWD